MSQVEQSQNLKIPFKKIQEATNNFNELIGKGGYGQVYKGKLFISGQLTTVAVKRLNEQFGQGLKEFLTEIELLSGQNHENVISLLGYCNEGKEKIIVYEYADLGSFNQYIKRTDDVCSSNNTLTWLQRLKICADAARGLDHIHSHFGEHQSIIHRDIKSANILINEKLVAKISDFGLSRLSLSGLDRSAVISHACGTPGYCDPEYIKGGIVTKKSDVYSFGMVLFEALCGRLCNVKEDDGFLLSGKLAKEYYKENKLDEIVDPSLMEQMSSYSMRKFSAIAYRCLHDDREQRPNMDVVKNELEETLKIQVEYEKKKKKKSKGFVVPKGESYWETKLPQDWEVITTKLNISHGTKKKLFFLLHRGILFDEGNMVLWINDDGKKCLLISAKKFLSQHLPTYPRWVSLFYLRFSTVAGYYYKECRDINCEIKSNMLSLGTMYAASLVFKYREQPNKDLDRLKLVTVKWKTQDFRVCSTHTAELITNNWYKIKLWHFINQSPDADFDIVIEELSYYEDPVESELLIQGIEFHPVEMHEETKRFVNLSIPHEDEYWEKKLPDDYPRYIKMAYKPFKYTNKEELYLRMCEGFLILGDHGRLWFSVCKSTGGICFMIPARNTLSDDYNYKLLKTLSLSKSRFGEVKKLEEAFWYSF